MKNFLKVKYKPISMKANKNYINYPYTRYLIIINKFKKFSLT